MNEVSDSLFLHNFPQLGNFNRDLIHPYPLCHSDGLGQFLKSRKHGVNLGDLLVQLGEFLRKLIGSVIRILHDLVSQYSILIALHLPSFYTHLDVFDLKKSVIGL